VAPVTKNRHELPGFTKHSMNLIVREIRLIRGSFSPFLLCGAAVQWQNLFAPMYVRQVGYGRTYNYLLRGCSFQDP